MSKHKLMLPILAAIVGVAASAFTTIHKENQKADQPSLYWYKINSDFTLGALQNTTPETKSDAMPGGASPLTNCEDNVSPDCLRGYTTTQTVGDPAPAPAGDDYHIQKTN